ncbi:hypothetical protein BC830DRAFT_544785 [Chytriomyces sp. MP71]|nr:hypothetical protein BC830DRAFT_544785 [Chytriomyces sp. MP71]
MQGQLVLLWLAFPVLALKWRGEETQHLYVPVAEHSVQPISRVEIRDFFTPTNEKEASLFLLAFEYIQRELNETDPRSFAALASIHGEPTSVVFDSYPGEKMHGGYCQHGNVLFPTWHRPLIALVESVIIDVALNVIAPRYASNDSQSWMDAATSIRFPYYDWASDASFHDPHPSIFGLNTVEVLSPPYGRRTNISNPLYDFTVPTRYHANFPQKLRKYPSTTYREGFLDRRLVCQSRDQVRLLFDPAFSSNWSDFSNHSTNKSDRNNTDPRIFHSVEYIHDKIHVAVGGYMGRPALAAYDPFFYFHHCNVDRLIALHQATVGGFLDAVNASQPLAPFRIRANSDATWTSNDARSVLALGYTYPELVDGAHGEDLRRRLLRQYSFVHPDHHVKADAAAMMAESGKQAGSTWKDLVPKLSFSGDSEDGIDRKSTSGWTSVYAHFMVDKDAIGDAFRINFYVKGRFAAMAGVFAMLNHRNPHGIHELVLGGNAVLTHELMKEGLLGKPELWKEAVTIEVIDSDGESINLDRLPSLWIGVAAHESQDVRLLESEEGSGNWSGVLVLHP